MFVCLLDKIKKSGPDPYKIFINKIAKLKTNVN